MQTGEQLDNVVAGMTRADGTRLWLAVNTQWIDAALGSKGGTIATLVDITERIEHGRKLEKSNSEAQKNLAELQTYRSALDQHTIVSITDARGNIVFVNRRFCDISGYTQEELLGHDHSLINSRENPAHYFDYLWTTISSGKTWRGEICNRAKNGTLFWVDSTIAPVLNHEGEIDQYIAIFYDLTQRRLGERHLRESRERFKSLLAMSSDWYWESDSEHRITLISEGIDHTGLNHTTIMGKFLWDLEVDREDKSWALHRATAKVWGDFSNFEFRIKNPKPEATPAWLWLSISGKPMRNSSGVNVGYRGVGRDVTSRRSAQDQLWDLANLDPLTGLPNRMRFNDALTHAVTQAQQLQQPFALAMIDLDNFKEVNDSLGHDVGDELLCTVAERLSKALRGNDMIARIGGDEFGVLIHGLGSGSGLARPLDAMMASMNEPIEVGGQLRRYNLSMGVTLYPSDSTETANLIKNADIALYRAKAAGRGQYVLFHPELKSDVDRTATLMHEIEAALAQNQLLLHYQPVVDVSRGTVIGLEALLRWQHPVRGLITAGTFTQVFDNMGVAARIGRLVTQLALAQVAEWVSQDVAFRKVAINVSAGDFLLGTFPSTLATQLEHHKVSPEHFAVEVTEGMFLGRTALTVLDGINKLHGMGVEVSFDDFGTGYASLMHLKLPIDRLKIDRSFVHDIDTQTTNAHTNAAIVQAVTDLGRRLGKDITVEGAETESQVRMLTDMGCTQFQGNHFSLPLAAEDVPAFIKQFNLQYRTPSDFPALHI
jgi:diguanylate cyclase (GGDEF)-like protein/PAS domain S-box-containing protein